VFTIPSKHLDEQLCRFNFAAEFYYLKVQNPIFHVFYIFQNFNPQIWGRSKFGAHFGVVGKPIS